MTKGLEKKNQSQSPKDLLILGVGNLIMGDEGVGIHTIREIDKLTLPPGVETLDGGTGGFHLLSYLEEFSKVIIVDASMDGKPAGTISLIKPKYSKDFPKSLSVHDIGLKDLVESVEILGKMPEIFLVTVSIQEIVPMTMELSKPVAKSIKGVIQKIEEILETLSFQN